MMALGCHRLRVLALAASVFGCAAAPRAPRTPGASTPRWEQTLTVAPTLRELSVTTCFDGSLPTHLQARSADAQYTFLGARLWPSGASLTLDDDRVVIPSRASPCVRYGVDLSTAGHGLFHGVARVDDALIIANSTWLWRPDATRPAAVVPTRIELPSGVEVSTPWPRQGDVHLMDATAFQWEGYLVVGRFEREELRHHHTVFDVARLGRTEQAADLPLTRWLGGAADAISTLTGDFPADRVQVLLVPSSSNGDAVGFGLTSRGGGASVLFTVNPDAPPTGFDGNWVAVHEFVHFIHPVLADDDAWLREGLATYYQEVLRARAGMQSPQEAWTRLARGLHAGMAAPDGRPLGDESARMHDRGSYLRVYWAGAALALMGDVEIRRATHGRSSLDAVVRALYHEGHADPTRVWTAADVSALFDRSAGTRVWGDLTHRALRSARFPDVDRTLRELGVRIVQGRAALDARAPLAPLRDAIMARADTPR